MKYKWLVILVGVALVGLALIGGCAPEAEQKHVTFTTGGPWSGDWLTIYVPKIILEEEFGYTTEIAYLSIAAAWVAIGSGEADLWTDSWQPNQEDMKKKFAETTESLGIIYGNCRNGLLIPKWVSEKYGITSVSDLKDPQLAKLFDDDGDGVGDVMGCDPGWACAEIIDEQLAAYGLDDLYEQKYGSETMITVAIEGKLKKNEPVLYYMYEPQPTFVKYPPGEAVIFLKDPKEFWLRVDVYKFGNLDWVKNHPKGAEILRQVRLSREAIGWAIAEIQERGDNAKVYEQLAREWMAEHQSEVDSWVNAAKRVE